MTQDLTVEACSGDAAVESIQRSIQSLRGHRVMLDVDLAYRSDDALLTTDQFFAVAFAA